jgi:hypothetical protein
MFHPKEALMKDNPAKKLLPPLEGVPLPLIIHVVEVIRGTGINPKK